MQQKPRGKWKVTRTEDHFEFGPCHSLFVDGFMRACYAVHKLGHALAQDHPSGNTDVFTAQVCLNEATARKLCLKLVGLTESQVEAEDEVLPVVESVPEVVPTDPTLGVPEAFLKWEE